MNCEIKKNNYIIRLAEEKDTKEINAYLNKHKKNNCINVTNRAFVNALITPIDYSDLMVRNNLYSFSEEFILVENEEEIEAVISVKVSNNMSRVFVLNLLLCESLDINKLREAVKFLLIELPKRSIISPTKIRTFIGKDNVLAQYWIDIFNQLGFKYETTRNSELESGQSVISLEIDTILDEELTVC